MLTKNWYSLIRGMAETIGVDNAVSEEILKPFSGNITCYVDNSNSITSNTYTMFFRDMEAVRTQIYNGYDGVIFGNGTAIPTEADVNISGSIITTIQTTSVTTKKNNGDGSSTKTAVYTISNIGSEDITISEIGYFGKCVVSYIDEDNVIHDDWSSMFLIDHTLLDEPVTIPAGGVGQVTYTVTFNIA